MNASNTPAWLFSFVDLAFLLLIAMTQLAAEPGPDFGEIAVPRIRAESTDELPPGAPDRWQLRVHTRAAGQPPPFELVLVAADGSIASGAGAELTLAQLRVRLAELDASQAGKPLLAPHADARSQDLLDALSAIEERWPSRRRATVARVFE